MPEKEEARENSQARPQQRGRNKARREPTQRRVPASLTRTPAVPAVAHGSIQSTLSHQPKGSLSTEVKSYPISIQILVMAPILPQVQILTGSHLPQDDVLWQAAPVQRALTAAAWF